MLEAVRAADGRWGVRVSGVGLAQVVRERPVEVEVIRGGKVESREVGYERVEEGKDGFMGEGVVEGPSGVRFEVRDRWVREGAGVRVERRVVVRGEAEGGFMTGLRLDLAGPTRWTEGEWFIPGVIYGGFEHLTETAIGGRAHYKSGDYTVRVREDRLPAPLVMGRFGDGSWVGVLNARPVGETTAEEGATVAAGEMVDEQFTFGAIGGEERKGRLSVGYWYPGSEGEVTYSGDTWPGGQIHGWRRRHHPMRDGVVQEYEVRFGFGRSASFPRAMASAWRWAWESLKPRVEKQDIAGARRAVVDVLSRNVIEKEGRAGIPIAMDAVTGDLAKADRRAIMGFTGKNLEAAYYLLREAELEGESERGRELRRKGEGIIGSMVRLKMSPPEGEGFYIDDGRPINSQRRDGTTYLRVFGDDLKQLLRAYAREKGAGRAHPEWLAWCEGFAGWLLPQQREDGGFPRSWKWPSGEVASASPNSSYNAVVMLVELWGNTGEKKYLAAAERAGEFCWVSGQSRGRFVGGTIDNPDVLDKEAGTLSLEAYLALYEATKERKWLTRAQGAADFAETWVYLWNVPMPAGQSADARHWKEGVSTVGVQLISTGHSLVDAYMAFDADEFAKMYAYTGDRHYLEVARVLLHNTKGMLAMEARTFDLPGPGWQQEHWSLAPRRGRGLHRAWLPWVGTSQLNGIFGVMDLDEGLRRELVDGVGRK